MPFTQINDISVYYELHGGAGSPLLLIQGYMAAKVEWPLAHLEHMAARHRVIIFDNRGVGQTDQPTTPYSMAQFAADSVGLLDALAIEQAHVLGVSMGGMIAQHLALTYPERVLGLVLGCTMPGDPLNQRVVMPAPEVLAALTKPPSGDRAHDLREAWPILYTSAYIEQNRAALESKLELQLAYPAPAPHVPELQFGAILQTHDTYDRLDQIKQPTLVQTGLDDILVPPQNSKIIAEHIPGARLIEYPAAAHVYLEETGMTGVNDILAFLAELDAQP